jgi:hypothetical protein
MAFRLLPVRFGKDCPHCMKRTDRIPFPAALGVLKFVARGHLTFRECRGCGWRGFFMHREKSRRMSRNAAPAR